MFSNNWFAFLLRFLSTFMLSALGIEPQAEARWDEDRSLQA